LSKGSVEFAGAERRTRERPAYHPGTLLKIYVYGYLNRIQSSRRLEREAQRNVELIWLTGRLAPDFKTIADFRRDNGPAIRTDRNAIRMAIGQLCDYRRFVPAGVACAILLPELPREEVACERGGWDLLPRYT